MDLKKEKMVSILLVVASLFVVSSDDTPTNKMTKKVSAKEDRVSTAQAAPANTTLIKKLESKASKDKKKFSGEFSITTNTDTERLDSDQKNYSSDFRLISGYQVNEDLRISTWIEFENLT